MSCVPSINAYVACQACHNHCTSDIKVDDMSTNCANQNQQGNRVIKICEIQCFNG